KEHQQIPAAANARDKPPPIGDTAPMEPTPSLCRRSFVASAAGLAAAGLLPAATVRALAQPEPAQGDSHRGAVVVASANGQRTVARALELIRGGSDCVDAIVEGVAIQEADPGDASVGYGGLPNEEGVVQLDASVMHGPTHKAGAVACIEGIMHPAAVALQVLKRTDHALLVGEGAKRFALRLGFPEENLLTDQAREAWVKWKSQLNPDDDWLNPDQRDLTHLPHESWRDAAGTLEECADGPLPFAWGALRCSAVDGSGDLAGGTTPSGLSWKIPGRVGYSPIVGAGMFCDNAVGAAGATGRGEAAIH